MLSTFKYSISKNLVNIPGWFTNRKIIVIESDDWGSIRMPSNGVYSSLLKNGIRVNECPYCSNDSRETAEDLEMLYETLLSVKDKNNNPGKVTANFLVANPDFDAIERSNYQNYSFKRLDQDESYGANMIKLVLQGNDSGLFHPQSHGREHLNIRKWMELLKAGSKETRLAFNYKVYGISTKITEEKRSSYLAAFDFETKEEQEQLNVIAKESLEIFKEIFGYQSKSFIFPNYIWDRSLEKTLFENGVKYLQGNFLHRYILHNGKKGNMRLRCIGFTSKSGLINLSRNVHFEPTLNPKNNNSIKTAIKSIETAFVWNKPAIISAHRLNFMGSLHPDNRDRNLLLLKQLLILAQQKWPDIEFMSSDELGDLIKSSRIRNG